MRLLGGMGKIDSKRAVNDEVKAGIPWSKLSATPCTSETLRTQKQLYPTVKFLVRARALVEHIELKGTIKRFLNGEKVAPRLDAI